MVFAENAEPSGGAFCVSYEPCGDCFWRFSEGVFCADPAAAPLPDYIFKRKSTFTFYIDYTKELLNHGFCFFCFVIKILLYREKENKNKVKDLLRRRKEL